MENQTYSTAESYTMNRHSKHANTDDSSDPWHVITTLQTTKYVKVNLCINIL